jgi:predicted phosphodiesterase
MSEERILALFDTHVPHNIPLEPVWEFAQDFKPTIVVLGGDVHDWGSVSHWAPPSSRVLDGGTIAENYAQLVSVVLQPAFDAAPKARVVFITGNHEGWLTKEAAANPQIRKLVELQHKLPKEVEIVPEKQAFHVNKHLCYLHGLYTVKYHAYHTVHAVHKSVFYGHTHDIQRYTDISPVDVDQFYTGASCGCLCNLNPSYALNAPNRWVNGFQFNYVDTKTDEFYETQVYIVNGKFKANGRTYK